MYYNDRFDPHADNDFDKGAEKELELLKQTDRGYCKIYKNIVQENGKSKRTKIEMYASGDVGSNIRDAETGVYYKEIVGSTDEDAFFKVGMSAGDFKSLNGNNSLFYLSPEHYLSHQHIIISEDNVQNWDKIVQKWNSKQV